MHWQTQKELQCGRLNVTSNMEQWYKVYIHWVWIAFLANEVKLGTTRCYSQTK